VSTAPAYAKQVFELLREDLSAIERQFGHDTVSNVRAITEIGEYLRNGGGKRIRPMLLLLANKLLAGPTSVVRVSDPCITPPAVTPNNGSKSSAGNRAPHNAIRLGAVVEIIHTATLVHDDIIDEAEIRRGRPAANTKWGNSKCVLAGDWLYMQAFRVAIEERNFRVLDVLIDLTQKMVEGELLQTECLGRCVSMDEYFDLIYRKTACLFSVCMRLGGIIANASAEQEEKLAAYGHNLGMAFQVVDDVLDLTASEEVLGKPVASDLREGKATMAVIHALERCQPAERAKIEKVLTDRGFREITHQDILDILKRYDSVECALTRASQYAHAAIESLREFPDSEFKNALLWLPEFVVAREK
jgi:octaprenyl-diphosphate synthase